MRKSKLFFIVTALAITLIGCAHVDEGTFIEGTIKEINETRGDMEIEIKAWTTVSESGTSPDSFGFVEVPTSQTIRISNPEDYDGGQKVKVKVIKNYKEDVWDLERLKFEVEEVN